MNSLFGMRIQENPLCANVPRMQLSKKVADIISYAKPEFVAETNAWMKQFFGTHDVAYIINPAYFGMNAGEMIVTSPRAIAMLKGMRP